ncbi:MAG TPA: alpha/beta fold hydrolase [Thermoanaerobaculia bacterium]|nr:alpha/beta fold hydrolase [Thermoanaerobaculia bacterium]
MSTRALLLAATLLMIARLALPLAGQETATPSSAAPAVRREIRVPLDHAAPDFGTGTIRIEMARPFDPKKPTLLIVADGQQFYLLREGAVARLEQERFGDGFNLVGVIGRGFSEDVVARTRRADGSVDWALAYRLLGSRQWVEDLDLVRRELVGADGKVLLYGVSGGGTLVHEYLAVHGSRVTRAVSESGPVRHLDAWLRLNHDRAFWNEIQASDPRRATALSAALAKRPDRPEVIQLLQRQHYFVAVDDLAAERRRAIDEIVAGNEPAIAKRKEAYQVHAMRDLLASDTGVGIRVRMYEFVEPLLRHVRIDGQAIHPNIENEAILARPLLDLQRAGTLPAPPFDRRALQRVPAEVLVIGARHDQTSDYRALIANAALYPRGELFLADDNHMLMRLTESGARKRLLSTFLLHGLGSPEMEALLREIEPYRWTEG